MTRPQAYKRLALLLFIFAGLSFFQSWRLPLHEAPDEVAHFLYTRFIARTGRLPLDAAEREAAGYRSDWPGLYNALTAVLTGWSDTDEPPRLKFVWQSPRFDLARELLATKRLANTEDELPPFRGAVFMWRLGRVVSILLSLGTIGVAFLTALEIWPKNYRLAILSAAVIAFTPTFMFISSAMSDDSLVGLLLGLYVWVLIRIVNRETALEPTPWGHYLGLGLLMGLAASAKYSTVLLPVQLVAVVVYLTWRYRLGLLAGLGRISLVAGAAMLASSWWYGTLIVYFNEIDEYGLVVGALKPILAGGIDASQRYAAFVLTGGTIGIQESPEFISEPFWAWALHIYQSFWVRQIENYPLAPAAHLLIGLACLIALAGLGRAWRRRPNQRLWIVLFVSHALLFLTFPILRHAIQGNVSQTAQGRHVLFPVATVLPILMIYGWQGWLSTAVQRRLALLIVSGLACWSMAQLIRIIDYPLLYLPVRTTPDVISAIPHRLDQPFGDYLLLRGYAIEMAAADNALDLKLYWQSPAYVDEDYRMDIELVREENVVLRWTRYPLNGRYPTRIWEQWETIRDDIRLPLVDAPPGAYQIRLRLHGAQGTLPAGDQEWLLLSEITVPLLPAPQPDILTPVTIEDRVVVQGATLWQAETYRRSDLPEYRPRMQIPFVWSGQAQADERIAWRLIAPGGQAYQATPATPHFGYFTIGPDWVSGDYRLRVEVWRDEAVVAARESEPLVRIINKKPRLLEPPPITHRLEANFVNRLDLLGYDLPVRSVSPGQGIPLTLYWQGRRTMGRSYTVFAKLLDDDQKLWSNVERLPADYYETFYWFENEVVIDAFELPVSPNTPEGVYWINAGLYEEIEGQAVSLPLVLDGKVSDVASVTFGPVKIGRPALPIIASPQAIAPQYPLSVALGEPAVISLRGYDVTTQDGRLTLKLYWESLAAAPTDWSRFVHVRNEAGETVTQKDGPAGSGRYPTSIWGEGEIVIDEATLPVDALPDGPYNLIVGLYDLATGQRLSVPGSPANEIMLSEYDLTND